MLTMNEIVDLRMQQQLAHEIYRQQIMQRIPDPFLPLHGMAHHAVLMPARPTLPGVEAKLENDDLWQQFHKIGTEMIITKSGRRMFPSLRLSVSGLEEESNYCMLLEMVPIGDCRFKFSGSQWVPAGGAEPQSPQRMFLHPDSPATGAHWQAQAILFNKVKLTNNTLDNSGHVVLASMHKYQPRFHIIRTSDLTQLPWEPQQAFVFPETEFVAVTAYQNDRVTKLKIDNNPFAKGFRESGQSRCKRKMTSASAALGGDEERAGSPSKSSTHDDDRSSIGGASTPTLAKRRRRSSLEDEGCFSASNSIGSISPRTDEYALTLVGGPPPPPPPTHHHHHHLLYHHQQQQQQQHQLHHHTHHPALLRHAASLDLAAAAAAAAYFNGATAPAAVAYAHPTLQHHHQHLHHHPHHQRHAQHQQRHLQMLPFVASHNGSVEAVEAEPEINISCSPLPAPLVAIGEVSPTASSASNGSSADALTPPRPTQAKRNNFSISAILAE